MTAFTRTMKWSVLPISACLIVGYLVFQVANAQEATAEEPLYSGPQVGEPLPGFVFRQVLGGDEPKEVDLVKHSDGGPIVLIFIHDVNRPSVAMTRALTRYTLSRAQDGLKTGVILLGDDATTAEQTLLRIQHALTPNVPTGVSLEGREGPGAYGLNRLVQMTILIGNQGKVTSNHALVQPSLQADLPKIVHDIVQQIGGDVPKLEQLLEETPAMRNASRNTPSESMGQTDLRMLLRPLLAKDASDPQIDAIAKEVETKIEADASLRREIGRIATTIVRSGKLSNYGTPRTQFHLKAWAEKYGDQNNANATSKP